MYVYLYEGVFDANDAKAVGALFVDFVDDEGFCLLACHFAIGGNQKVENQVDATFPLGHAEIVQREAFVHRLYRVGCHGTQLVYLRIVGNDRVEVDGYDTAEFFVHIPLHFIDFLVRDVDVEVGGHLGVEGDDLPTGTVVVYHDVVNPDDARVILGEFVDTVDEGRVGRGTEKKVDRFLCRFYARKENERGDQNTRIPVDAKAREFRYDCRNQNERGGDAIAQTVESRRFNRGGVNGLADLFIKEEEPNLDEDCHAKEANGSDAHARDYGIDDFFHGGFQKLEADEDDDHIHDKAGDVFESAVSQRVLLIYGFARKAEAD